MKSILLVINLVLVVGSETARILAYFPVPSISHQVVFRPLTQELVRRGHEVTVITTDPAFPIGRTPANLTEIDVGEVSYNLWGNSLPSFTGKKNELPKQVRVISEHMNRIVDKQLENEEVKYLIKNRNNDFDLLILEAPIRSSVAFTHVFKAPAILISSFGDWLFGHSTIGSPIHPILFPATTQQTVYDHSLYEKFQEIYLYLQIQYVEKSTEDEDLGMLRKHLGQDLPGFKELRDNIDMLFLNMHPIWENNRPVPPSVVYMGGIHQTPPKELPKDLKTYLDSSKNGVIYMSFGTNTKPSLLPPEKIQMFVKVFSELPYDVLWKWDTDELPGKTQNIRIEKWLPQTALLRHPKIKLFIMQGGLQSTDEAITAAVPLLGIPMLGDQWYNTHMYVKQGIGLRLDIETISEEVIKNSINEILNDDSYRRNIVKLRELMKDDTQSALDRAVWWTEYVIRHKGAKHLRSPAANLSWYQYIELELIVIVLLVLLVILVLLSLALRYLINLARKHVNVCLIHSNLNTKTKLKDN